MAEDAKPLRRDAERNRQRIMQAASELFAERGLAVSLDDIAAQAGVGVGTVYRRFKHRDDLVDALFTDRIARLVANGEAAAALDDPWEAVVQLLEGYMEIQAGDRAFGPVVLTDAHGRGGLDDARIRLRPLVARIVERAQAAGVVRPDLATTDVPMMILMMGQVMNATREVAPDVWRRYLALLLDGLRARPGAGHPPTPLAPEPVDALAVPTVMREAFTTIGR